jgi:hypothetical protein
MHRYPVYLGGVRGSNAAVVEMKRETLVEFRTVEEKTWDIFVTIWVRAFWVAVGVVIAHFVIKYW